MLPKTSENYRKLPKITETGIAERAIFAVPLFRSMLLRRKAALGAALLRAGSSGRWGSYCFTKKIIAMKKIFECLIFSFFITGYAWSATTCPSGYATDMKLKCVPDDDGFGYELRCVASPGGCCQSDIAGTGCSNS